MQTRLSTEERRAEIVAAALRLAQLHSPGLITTTDMAQAVGLTQGALFKHFASKEAIWLAAMGWVRTNLLADLKAGASASDQPLQALGAMFRAHVGFVVAHPGVPRLIFHELQRPEDSPIKQEVRELLVAYRQLLRQLLDTAAAQGLLRPGLDQDAAASLFIGLMQGLVMQSMLTGQVQAMTPQAAAVLPVFFNGISHLSEVP
jgi:TetR/AcrR family transcriptional regulator